MIPMRALPHIAALLLVTAVLPIWILAAEPLRPPDESWFPGVPPLPKPRGQIIDVSDVEGLFRAAEQVKPGGTIRLADGHYRMPRFFELHTDNVTLRSASGNRERVVIDGATSRHGELIGITACSGVTIADLTIQNIKYNGFKINSDSGVQRVTIHNCIVHNIWQRGVKGVRVPPGVRPPTDCRVQGCLFYNDRAKQCSSAGAKGDDPTDTPETFGGNYIGGIDVMYAQGWTISDNVFIGIKGRTGEARGAVFLWHDSRDCRVERNIIIDCDSGICLGNSHKKAETKQHCWNCVVANNFITRAPENGILADYTQDCAIVHNTIHDPKSRLRRLIRLVHDNEGLLVANNLLSGPAMRIETDSDVRFHGNVTRPLGASFVDERTGNLYLKGAAAGVTGAVGRLSIAENNIGRRPRANPTNVGAD